MVVVENKTVTFANAFNTDSTVSHLTPLKFDKLFHDDILQLLPNITSGESFPAETTLSIQHTFTVSGLPFTPAPRKLGPQKQFKLSRNWITYLTISIIQFSSPQYTCSVHSVLKKEQILSDSAYLAINIIKFSSSLYTSPVHLVLKKELN